MANGLIEDDYATTDWEGEAGEHGEDVGYMPFPITVGGTQYALAGGDYASAINVNASDENKTAAMIFLKWLTGQKAGRQRRKSLV